MTEKKIQKLIVKYITASISAEEWDELQLWLAQPENEKIFNDFVEINFVIDHTMKAYDTKKSKELLLNKIRRDKRLFGKYRFRNVLKYAAIVIFSVGIGYIIHQQTAKEETVGAPMPVSNFITLELEDGNIKVISEDGTSEVRDALGNVVGNQVGNQLVYSNKDKSLPEKLVYNTLKVPYGKHFKLQLSDSTIAHLNAGSSLKYPIKFLKGKDRTVFLTGEAFLEVAKDTEHPFIINADDLNIKVFGTKFNISAYREDEVKEVVLVEGSVGLYVGAQASDSAATTVLSPGIKGSYDNTQKNITTEPVITSIYTSWVQGELVFRNMTFENILKKLERQYDVTIINENSQLSSVEFNASFDDMPIGKILEYFKGAYDIDFTIIDDKKIIVN